MEFIQKTKIKAKLKVVPIYLHDPLGTICKVKAKRSENPLTWDRCLQSAVAARFRAGVHLQRRDGLRRIAIGDLLVVPVQVTGAAVVGEAAAEPRLRRGTADGANHNGRH